MLVEFVNTRPEEFAEFRLRWEAPNVRWPEGAELLWTQRIIGDIWEGKKSGIESFQIELSLGLRAAGVDEPLRLPPFRADWEAGELFLAPRDLRDLIWLTLLQHSARLGICDNKDGDCPTPYFLKQKRRQRFCSDACAQPAQREFKRQWWREHGEKWRQERREKKKRGTSSKRK